MNFGIISFLGGLIISGLFFYIRSRDNDNKLILLKSKLEAGENIVIELKEQNKQKEATIESIRSQLELTQQAKAVGETRLDEARKNIEEQKKVLGEATQKLSDTFKALSSDALVSNNQTFMNLANKFLENFKTDLKGDMNTRQESLGRLIDPLKDTLKRYEDNLNNIENDRKESYGALNTELKSFNEAQIKLQDETRNLVDALKKPQVRGRWGEITLRRVVEAAGMSKHCDFTEQVSMDTDEGRQRPDLIVTLPGERVVVVDAKAPLKAYLEAVETQDDKERENALIRHAKAVREHMRMLSSKVYWNQFSTTPDFVVLFLPGESFFSAALEQDRELLMDGVSSKVILATPTTLIALLRTVAFSWQQQHMQENSMKIAEAGAVLFERVCKFVEHLDDIRKNLENATHSFNRSVGSLESRIIPGARRLKELGVSAGDKELKDVQVIEAIPRKLNV